MRPTPTTRGFTLVEALIVIALIGIVALVAIPVLRSEAPSRMDAAAAEVANVLRFAVSEAKRTGSYVLIDASAAGHVRVYASNASGAPLGALNDPLTKAAMDLDISAHPWSNQIGLTPLFMNGGTAYRQLLVGPAGQLQVFDAGTNRGPLQFGSGVVLSSGTLSAKVAIHESLGRVSVQ